MYVYINISDNSPSWSNITRFLGDILPICPAAGWAAHLKAFIDFSNPRETWNFGITQRFTKKVSVIRSGRSLRSLTRRPSPTPTPTKQTHAQPFLMTDMAVFFFFFGARC